MVPDPASYYFNSQSISHMVLDWGELFASWKLGVCLGLAAVAFLFFRGGVRLGRTSPKQSRTRDRATGTTPGIFRQSFAREYSGFRTDWPAGLLFLLVLALGVGLRLAVLTRDLPINYLEWWTLQSANLFPEAWQVFLGKSNIAIGHQGLFNLWVRFLSWLTPDIDILRAVSSGLAILFFLTTWILLRQVLSPRPALAGWLALAVSPALVEEAPQFQIYNLFLLLAGWQLILFFRVFIFRRARWRPWFIALSVLLFFLHYFAVVQYFWQFMYLLWRAGRSRSFSRRGWQRRFGEYLKSAGVITWFCLPVIPFVLTTFERGENIFNPLARTLYFGPLRGLTYPLDLLLGHFGFFTGYWWASLYFTLLFLMLIWLFRRKRGVSQLVFSFLGAQLLAFLIMQMAMALSFERSYPNFRHYFILALPFAWGMGALWRRHGWIFVLLFLCLNAFVLWQSWSREKYPDFRSTARHLKAQIQESDLITFPNNLWREPFFYYFHSVPELYLYNRAGYRPLDHQDPRGIGYYYFDLSPRVRFENINRVWVVRGRVRFFGREAYSPEIVYIRLAQLEKKFQLKDRKFFGLAALELYERKKQKE